MTGRTAAALLTNRACWDPVVLPGHSMTLEDAAVHAAVIADLLTDLELAELACQAKGLSDRIWQVLAG